MTPGNSNDVFTIKLWTYDLDLNIILFLKKKKKKSFTSNQIEECLAWSFTWVSVYVSLHDTDYGIEFMLMKSARNVKVGVEGSIQSNLDKLDTGNRNNKWNSKGDKGQALHLCRNHPFKQNTEQLLRKHSRQSRVWDYSRWQLSMSQQCHTCEKKVASSPVHIERIRICNSWWNFMLRQLQHWDQFWSKLSKQESPREN